MPAFVLLSAKGSPGVTTAAAALTAVATTSGRALLAELDPSGGSVQVFTGGSANPGLIDVAGRLRREASPSTVEESTTQLPAGVPALLAPSAGRLAESVIESAGARWVPVLRALPGAQVMVDAGRWEVSQRSARRIVGADLLVMVCRPTLAGVEHSRHLLDRVRELARRPVVAVVVGDRPYAPEEVAAHLDVPLAGTLAWDSRGVSSLWAHGATRPWLRTWLARSARATLAGLTGLLDVPATSPALPSGSSPASAAAPATGTGPPSTPAEPPLPPSPDGSSPAPSDSSPTEPPPLPPPPPPPPPGAGGGPSSTDPTEVPS